MFCVFGYVGNNKLFGKVFLCSMMEIIYGFYLYEGLLFDNLLSEIKLIGWILIVKVFFDIRKEFEVFDVDGKNVVYLIIDGEEMCGGDFVVEIEKFCELNVDIIVNIIGFNFDIKGNEEMK